MNGASCKQPALTTVIVFLRWRDGAKGGGGKKEAGSVFAVRERAITPGERGEADIWLSFRMERSAVK